MTVAELEKRVVSLEHTLEALRQKVDKEEPARPWWEQVRGTFKDDPIYDEAMRLGRAWRDAADKEPTQS
ncbi:hypothetical protein [Armatimonas sp.]|uniref:hypothetical protein n=1 Tax=Armatimonas sp. TaxID=1872638 RepID=UPI00374FDDC8